MPGLLLFAFLWWAVPALAEGFLCAGRQGAPTEEALPAGVALKPAAVTQSRTTGTRRALMLFARFKGEPANPVPSWAADLFKPDLPGSFSHFYDTMSFGKLQVRGEVAPRVYESSQPAAAYLADDQTPDDEFGQFSLEILRQADRNIDFAQYDNDGPDGVPNSGDDDGVVDAVFIVVNATPRGFLLGAATGIANLGFRESLETNDPGRSGEPMRISPAQGTIQQGRYFAEAVGAICHEYGHVLGLPDLYNTDFLAKAGAGPEEDSAGVGVWCLMGWGATGWNGDDGPNSFCAWSRQELGWARTSEVGQSQEEMRLAQVGKTGEVYRVPVGEKEYFQLEYRTRTATYYDRHLPAEGLLIWHVSARGHLALDLECADGRWQDAGYPRGLRPDPQGGEDNLDFWAHDEDYILSYLGNLGDGTDPFDGVRFREFTPATNPSSYSLDGLRSVRLTGIRFDAGQAIAQVQTDSMRLEIAGIRLQDQNDDEKLHLGEKATLRFRVSNLGGLKVSDVWTVLTSADPLVRVVRPETQFGEVEIGPRAPLSTGEGFPQLSLTADPGDKRQVQMVLEVFSGRARLAHREFDLQLASTWRWSGHIKDEAGKGLGGIEVRIEGLAGSSTLTTDSAGGFQLDLRPGSYFAGVSDRVSAQFGETSFSQSYTINLSEDLYSELVMASTYPVSGAIHSPEGQPLPGVDVSAYAQTNDGRRYSGRAISSADGAFVLRLAKGTYDVIVRTHSSTLPNRVLSNLRVGGPQTLDIDLAPGKDLSAQLTSDQGPGPNLSISLSSLPFNNVPEFFSYSLPQLQTNIQGKGTVNVLPGVYLARILTPPRMAAPYGGYGFLLPVFADTSIQVALRRGVDLVGTVTDESIDPMSITYLSFVPPAPYSPVSTSFADDGAYAVQLPPVACQVVFEGFSPGKRLRQALGQTAAVGGTLGLTVKRGELAAGQVQDEKGQGLAGVEVQAFSAEAGVATATRTQADGSFGFYLQPGAYELTGVEKSSSYFPLGKIDVPKAGMLEIQSLPGGQLHGRVVDSQGLPIEQALILLTQDPRVLAKVDANPFSAFQISQSAGLAAAALSVDQGAYLLRARPGTYDLIVLPENGHGTGRILRWVELPGAGAEDLVLPTPERVCHLYGQLLEPPNALAGEVVLQFLDQQTGTIAHCSDGGYRGYGVELPPGQYQVRAGRLGPVGGFEQVYEIGSVLADRDMRWDIGLADAATAVAAAEAVTPHQFSLEPNYPNPFNPTTTIRFSLPQPGEAELAIYNLLGQRVATLVRGVQEAGNHVLQWDGRDEQGRELASGVYLCRLQAGAQVETRKVLLLR